MTQSVSDFFEKNWSKMEQIAKKVLKDRWREGLSSYYIHLYEKQIIPSNVNVNFYYYLVNLSKPQSEINYIPVTLRSSIDVPYENDEGGSSQYENLKDETDTELQIILKMDLGDEVLIDFLMNNHNNQKWIKLYQIFYEKKIELDLFEAVIFDYIFKQGLSIRQIAKLTNNSSSWIYRYRKSLLDKIKNKINED